MDKLVLILFAAALVGTFVKKTKGANGMSDTPISLENVRRGVKNGWYTCTLVHKQGLPAVLLSGKDTNGNTYSGVYPVSEDDWNTLKNEGYKVL